MDAFGRLLQDALDAAVNACTGAERAFIAVGEVALDDCCSGQVWSRLVLALPSGATTRGAPTAQACGVELWDVTIAVGAARCAHTVDDNGNAPTPRQLCEDALGATADMTALMQAIQCDLAAVRGIRRVRFIRWDPIGPEGGCVGGEWQVSVLVSNCVECD